MTLMVAGALLAASRPWHAVLAVISFRVGRWRAADDARLPDPSGYGPADGVAAAPPSAALSVGHDPRLDLLVDNPGALTHQNTCRIWDQPPPRTSHWGPSSRERREADR